MEIAKSRSCGHFDVGLTPGIASARSSSSGKVPSVFSEGLIPSDKSRLFTPPWPKLLLSAAVAAALILEGVVAARSEKKTRFLGKIFDFATPTFLCEKKWWGGLSMGY